MGQAKLGWLLLRLAQVLLNVLHQVTEKVLQGFRSHLNECLWIDWSLHVLQLHLFTLEHYLRQLLNSLLNQRVALLLKEHKQWACKLRSLARYSQFHVGVLTSA